MVRQIATILVFLGIVQVASGQGGPDSTRFTAGDVDAAQPIIGLHFTPAERESLMDELEWYLESYDTLQGLHLPNAVRPALVFDPVPPGRTFSREVRPMELSPPGNPLRVPENPQELAYYSVRDLGTLIRSRQITSVALTRMYIQRLKEYGDTLQCVISLLEDRALRQASRADSELAAGHYRGPLHGIPYGLKDLFAVRGTRTTWGAMPYKDQRIDLDATVVKKLDAAGAVLVAKLTLGALAMGDIWYGGKTRNPWNLEQGSSGSSAGPAAAVVAGLVPFAIGTETWGSIVSPSTRCGVTGLRPTFGRVSRYGGMALSWSMDKVGPIARSVEDCAIVFDAIRGPDGEDPSVRDLPFNYTPDVDFSTLRIGYIKSLFQQEYPNQHNDLETLHELRNLGAKLIPVTLPDYPVEALAFILEAEAGAAFQELTLSNRDSLLVQQGKDAWPNIFRAAQLIPAVEYIQANRARSVLIQKMATLMDRVDVYVAPSFGGNNLLLTNLTGHPCVVVPNGWNEKEAPTSISFIGGLYDEATVLAVAKAYQDATDFHLKHPPLFP